MSQKSRLRCGCGFRLGIHHVSGPLAGFTNIAKQSQFNKKIALHFSVLHFSVLHKLYLLNIR